MRALEVINPGAHTTIQDLGRIGFRDIGVPWSGPLDHISLRFANHLVGNPPSAPALEMLMLGPTLRVLADSIRVALVGCDASMEINKGARRIESGRSTTLTAGDLLRISPLATVVCGYLAVEGGFDIPLVLGSAATYIRGRIGGFDGRRLQTGDRLPLMLNDVPQRSESMMTIPMDAALGQPIRVILGPQNDYFSPAEVDKFLSSEYAVSVQSDRMGYRLKGPALEHSKGYNIVSDGIVSGSVQVPGSGEPIILMMDNPTTGGYPKIATVISADLPIMGRRGPGRKIRFQQVSMESAHGARREQELRVQGQLRSIRTI